MIRRLFAVIAVGFVIGCVAHPDNLHPESLHRRDATAQAIVSKAINALGGKDAMLAIKGVSSHSYTYRSQSLEESITPGFADTAIGTAGTQTISYDLTGGAESIIQRIDRQYMLGDFWYFGRPQLDPISASLVTRSDGNTSYSCYVKGNEGIYTPTFVPGGYRDPSQARVLLRDAVRLFPNLLLGFQVTPTLTAGTLTSHGIEYPAVTDAYLQITVAFRPDTYLPYIVRSLEDHKIYGPSTSDFILYNYSTVAGVKFPHRIKLMYNEENLLIDTVIDTVEVNPRFPAGFFDGLPLDQTNNTELGLPPLAPQPSTPYGDAEVFDNIQNLLWYGGYYGNLSRVTITYPHPELPNLIHLVFNDAPAYTTTIASMEDAVMVTDSPPHQSKLVIQWIHENLRRKVTHLLITHHHHDHNYGAADYVAEGAKLVVPESFKYYWQNIPGVKFATASESRPFIHKSNSMQVRGVWPGQKDVHAKDWMYFTYTVPCPTNQNLMAVTVADAWSPGAVGYLFGQGQAIQYLDIARKAQLQRNSLVIPIHGIPSNATELYELTGYDYPNFQMTDFIPGGPWCKDGGNDADD